MAWSICLVFVVLLSYEPSPNVNLLQNLKTLPCTEAAGPEYILDHVCLIRNVGLFKTFQCMYVKIHTLVAATFFFQVPSYISRSVAGSYDNEAVAIFALIFTFYLYLKVRFCYMSKM